MARVSKGKRQYLLRVYRSWVELRRLRVIFGPPISQPVLSCQALKDLNDRWARIRYQLNENAKNSMEEMLTTGTYAVLDVPVRRQCVIEIDKSTGQPRHGLPMVTLFTEKGPTECHE